MKARFTIVLFCLLVSLTFLDAMPSFAQNKLEKARATCKRLITEWGFQPAEVPASYMNRKLQLSHQVRDEKGKRVIFFDCITPPIGKFIKHQSIYGVFCEKNGCARAWPGGGVMRQYHVLVLSDNPGCVHFLTTHLNKKMSVAHRSKKFQDIIKKHDPLGGYAGHVLYPHDKTKKTGMFQPAIWLNSVVGLKLPVCHISSVHYDNGSFWVDR